MHHDPIIIKPSAPAREEQSVNKVGPSAPVHNPNNIYPATSGQTPTATIKHPEAALSVSLAEQNKYQSVANRLPDLKKSAYILLGLIILSALQFIALKSVVISMLGSRHQSSAFLTISNTVGWIIGAGCAITLLNTKRTKTAKTILLVGGVALLYFAITDLLVFNIISIAIDGFLLWWTYRLYQSVEASEM